MLNSRCIATAGFVALLACASAPPPDSEPTPITKSCGAFPYPIEAVRVGQQGAVTVKLYVDAAGEVINTKIEHSSGHAILDNVWKIAP
jgi:outer membrane biosynthesis protein TonB